MIEIKISKEEIEAIKKKVLTHKEKIKNPDFEACKGTRDFPAVRHCGSCPLQPSCELGEFIELKLNKRDAVDMAIDEVIKLLIKKTDQSRH